jgi:radical SAM superfamily enzyme YgiQ (UPF0313 family)
MKVVLIAPPIMDDFSGDPRPIAMDAVRECPPYGIYLLASLLREQGHEVTLADLIADGSNCMQKYAADIDQCGLVGIAATSMSWATAKDVITQVRERRADVPVVLGGIHPTMFDYYLLQSFPVDYIVRGEGEIALAKLCAALERGKSVESVPNLSWKNKKGDVMRNPVHAKIPKEELGRYPLPDFSSLPDQLYKGLSIESSRGCAFDCSFCSTSYRKGWRGIPPEIFVDRLESMMPQAERTAMNMIHIIDDEFSMNPRRAIEITDILRARNLHPWLVFDSRATDLLYEGYVPAIAEFTSQFLVGAECGYDEGLKRIGKGTTTKILEDSARLLYQNKLADKADYSFILGLPWESYAEVKKTCQFAAHLFATYGVRILLQWYCQIPGSRLWEEDRQANLVNETMYDNYGFFRDLYLFRTGVQLTPAEIWNISHVVSGLQSLAKFRYPEKVMVEYGHPEPIGLFFPEDIMAKKNDGLASLREVSRPAVDSSPLPVRLEVPARLPVSSERPLRHLS